MLVSKFSNATGQQLAILEGSYSDVNGLLGRGRRKVNGRTIIDAVTETENTHLSASAERDRRMKFDEETKVLKAKESVIRNQGLHYHGIKRRREADRIKRWKNFMAKRMLHEKQIRENWQKEENNINRNKPTFVKTHLLEDGVIGSSTPPTNGSDEIWSNKTHVVVASGGGDSVTNPTYSTRPMVIDSVTIGGAIGSNSGAIDRPVDSINIDNSSTIGGSDLDMMLNGENGVVPPIYNDFPIPNGGGASLESVDDPILSDKKPIDKKMIAIYGLVGAIAIYFGYKTIKG